MQHYYPPYERQPGPGDQRPWYRRSPWLFWLLLALALPLAWFLLACAVLSLVSLVLLFWLVGDLCVQLLVWLFGPYLLPICLCVLVLLLYEQGGGSGPRFPMGQPRDGDY